MAEILLTRQQSAPPSEKGRVFVLAHEQARRGACAFAMQAPEGWRVRFSPPGKSRDQEEKYHAMIADIAKQDPRFKDWDADDVKRMLVDAFAQVMRDAGTPLHHDGRIVPSLDGLRVVQLGVQTRRFWKPEAIEFITYLMAYGDEVGVVWSEPAPA